jgi:hypothetical protein
MAQEVSQALVAKAFRSGAQVGEEADGEVVRGCVDLDRLDFAAVSTDRR